MLMYSVSPLFLSSIRRGLRPITRADISFPGEGIVYQDLPVSGGSLALSRGAKYRGSGKLTIPDPTLAPVINDDSPLNPYGYEVIIKTGFQYPNGISELIPMGVYQIEDAEVGEDQVTEINFYDRARAIERADFLAPQDFAGKNTQQAIQDIALYAAPFYPGTGVEWTITFDVGLGNPVLPGGTVFDTGRWQALDTLTQTIAAEAYFDREGNIQVVPIPYIDSSTPLNSVAWEVDSGPDGVLISSSRRVSRNEVYNAVVVAGATISGGEQTFGFITDTDPLSRTNYGGPFGKSVKRVHNSALTTDAQCVIAATGILRNSTGLQRAISFNSLRNPALDLGDVILISHLDGSQNLVMLDSYNFNFDSGDMTGSIRSIQYV